MKSTVGCTVSIVLREPNVVLAQAPAKAATAATDGDALLLPLLPLLL
jgi:hypothetical protein